MAATTLASVAAATAAGYELVRVDFGDQSTYTPPRKNQYTTQFTKRGRGVFNSTIAAYGESNVNAAGADTAALASLNEQRNQRYGYDTTALRKDTYGNTQSAADV